jgi:hypothetical protein
MKRVEVVYVPYDSGVRDRRMGRGPLLLRARGLAVRLRDRGFEVARERGAGRARQLIEGTAGRSSRLAACAGSASRLRRAAPESRRSPQSLP